MDEEVQPSTFCPWQPKETPVIDHADRIWWRQPVLYQVYIRSLADGPLGGNLLPPDTAIWPGR